MLRRRLLTTVVAGGLVAHIDGSGKPLSAEVFGSMSMLRICKIGSSSHAYNNKPLAKYVALRPQNQCLLYIRDRAVVGCSHFSPHLADRTSRGRRPGPHWCTPRTLSGQKAPTSRFRFPKSPGLR